MQLCQHKPLIIYTFSPASTCLGGVVSPVILAYLLTSPPLASCVSFSLSLWPTELPTRLGSSRTCSLPAALVVLLSALAAFFGLGHADEPVEREGHDDVENAVGPEDTKVAPSLAVVRRDGFEEYVGVLD